MPLDPYSPCPGGTGKKLKFCCADLQGELDKVQRMIEGDQAVGCLEHLKKLEAKYPHRACLLSTRVELQMARQQVADAQESIAEFRQHHPDNPIALAYEAMLRATKGDIDGAVDSLQSAIEIGGQQMMPAAYEAIGLVAQALLEANRLSAGRAHLMLQAGLGADQDRRALSVLLRMNSSQALPVLFKDVQRLSPGPDGVSWKKAFDAALKDGQEAHWRTSERQFAALVPVAGSSPAIWWNLGILRSWLGNDRGAAEAWRKYAALDVPLDDAIEGEATAQLQEDDPVGPPIDMLTTDYPIKDFDELERRLSADRRVSRMKVDLAELTEEGVPPPRGAYWLLDRELPRTGVDLARTDVPNAIARFLVFGRETDREARLEFVVARDARLPAAKEQLGALIGDLLGEPTGEEVATHTPALQHALTWNWRFPDDTPAAHRKTLLDEQRKVTLFERWPHTPMRFLDGQTPLAASKNPAYKIRLLAAILNLELSATEPDRDVVYGELRTRLGLPAATPLRVSGEEFRHVRLARLHRLEIESLSRDDLLLAYSTAVSSGVEYVGRKCALAILERKQDFDAEVLGSVYRFLVQATADTTEALRYVELGRDAARAQNASLGQWDLDELHLRIERQEFDQMIRLIKKIPRENRDDQPLMQQFYNLLMQLGLIGPDGTLRFPVAAEAAPAAASSPLWTPESAQPAGEKSKLWLPGE